ncbi:MAG: preprotein translocase subunit SecE [Planctomyces sp.]|nr:preprotein translocase subunit SecE [Planctomyces sp.]
MATANTTFLAELFSGSFYKRNQGRLVRQATFFAIVAVVALGCITLANTIMSEFHPGVRTAVPAAFAALGAWFAWRVVNYPKFADFLIAVEGEMDKVSWPEWPYLWRALSVVLVVLVIFTVYLWLWDAIWMWLFKAIGFLNLGDSN